MNVAAARHAPAHDRQIFAEANRLLRTLGPERFRGRQQVDRFEPVGLALTVLAEDDVEAVAPLDFAAQVS
jgi:hypothetical protein